MGLRAIRRECQATLRQVPLPSPFSLPAFCEVISARRGRRLRLVPKQTRLGPCGVWLAFPDADYVIYEPETIALHRRHIILHELGHLLCDHDPHEAIDDKLLRQLFPSLDTNVVRRVLGRTTYSAVEEQQAEVMASLVQERAEGAGANVASWDETPDDALLSRVAQAFDARRELGDG